MEATQYIKQLASMSGISAENENLVSLLANEDLQKIEINDDLATQINGNFLTMESAKSNSELNKHFKATVLNGLDAETKSIMAHHNFSEEIVAEIANEQSSFKRVGLIVKQVSALEQAKATANKGDQGKLQLEIDRLNGSIAETNTGWEAKMNDSNAQWEAKFLDNSVVSMLSSYNYALPVSKDANVTTAKSLLNSAINEKGLQINNVNGVLTLKTNEGMEYFENNVKVSVSDFTDRVLSGHKLLKTSDQTPTPQVNPGQPTPTLNGGGDAYSGAIAGMIEEANK